jgi:ABC-type methionine transport system ATPase subunit
MGVLEFRTVSKVYHPAAGGRVAALSHASFAVGAGERLAIHGPVRAGKSTLLRLAYGAEQPSQGRVRVLGRDLGSLGARQLARVRRDLAVVPQETLLPADRTAFGQVTFVLRGLGFSHREATPRAVEALARVGLGQRLRALPAELGGEAWRVSLARALAIGPRLLLVDEPAPAGDASGRPDLIQILRDLDPEATTLLLVTRVPELARALGTRVLGLDGGELRLADLATPGPTMSVSPVLARAHS